jgi:hypothetical protein
MPVASCACGGVEVEVTGEPIRVSVCHCLACQRRTGSAFGAAARFADAQVTVRGETAAFRRTGDSGGEIGFEFCPRCGSTVLWRPQRLPGTVSVALGAFADPGLWAPTVSIYEARRHGWVAISGEVEHLD